MFVVGQTAPPPENRTASARHDAGAFYPAQVMRQQHGKKQDNGKPHPPRQGIRGTTGPAFIFHKIEKSRRQAGKYPEKSQDNEDTHEDSPMKIELLQTWPALERKRDR